MPALELIISASSPAELAGADLSPYDAACLGNPYCRRVDGNFSEHTRLLGAAVGELHAAGKRVYVTSPAVPRGRDLPAVDRLIEAAAAAGADALEVHNMGVLRRLRELGNPLPAHMGAFANVYTHLGAKVMKDYGAVRVRPNAEVSLEEMKAIAREGEVEVEVLVHGKIPLGVTDKCFLVEGPEEADPRCPAACREERWLTSGRQVLKTVGKGILSGKDMCMLEHLPLLVGGGFRVFKVEGLYETSAYRGEIGAVYREALEAALAGGTYAVRPEWAEAIQRHARKGLCNGYYFGKTGRLYIGTVLQENKPEV